MPFDWLHVDRKPNPNQAEAAKRVLAEEYRARAALLRRLGYTQDVALARCLARSRWDVRPGAPPLLSEDALRGLVTAAYA